MDTNTLAAIAKVRQTFERHNLDWLAQAMDDYHADAGHLGVRHSCDQRPCAEISRGIEVSESPRS